MKNLYCPEELGEDLTSKLVLGLTVPRPIGWIGTRGKDGTNNLAPFSFFNAVCDFPPVFLISASNKDDGSLKDTVKNIMDTKEFSINIVTEDLVHKMKITGKEFPYYIDEFEEAGLTPEEGKKIKAPCVAESPVNIECKLYDCKKVYDMYVIFGEAVCFSIRKDILDESFKVRYDNLKAIGRLAGDLYLKSYGECIFNLK